ncbi:Endonuclease/exonuclease/phosphatase [Canna indica]|uniref:Endonuclease/exonuclease/phosphatase n=1 Tax=Canna indica TaxID=4628 RepID=A0AAQ3Q4N8_9LILI|nr:Endonuclease/exonuclease/phosphatase [Canna indica]
MGDEAIGPQKKTFLLVLPREYTCRGKCLMNWETLHRQKDEGGVGLLNLHLHNYARLGGWLWKLRMKDYLPWTERYPLPGRVLQGGRSRNIWNAPNSWANLFKGADPNSKWRDSKELLEKVNKIQESAKGRVKISEMDLSQAQKGSKLTLYERIQEIPIWVQFPRLPDKYLNINVLAQVAIVVGKPLKIDKYTQSGSRGKFARKNSLEYKSFKSKKRKNTKESGALKDDDDPKRGKKGMSCSNPGS